MHSAGAESSKVAPIRVNVKVNVGNDKESPKFESPRFGTFNSPIFSEEEKGKIWNESKFQRSLRSPVVSASDHHVFHEVFQAKQGRYTDLPASKISEMMKSNNLDNAPTQSLLSVVNGILDESVERMNTEIPHRVACLLRKVVQEIERRISAQADHLRTQNNLLKARDDKYQSRLRVLEALASGSKEESEINATSQLQIIKNEKINNVEQKKVDNETVTRLMNEKEKSDKEISLLKQELDINKKSYELRCSELETEAKDTKLKLEEQLQKLVNLFDDSNSKLKELEADSRIKYQGWSKKENTYQSFLESQFDSLKELRLSSDSVKQEIQKVKENYAEEFRNLGEKLKAVVDAAHNHRSVLAENQKMFNELQELKGNIRVFCRVRPFIPGQKQKKTIVENIDENGELVVANPAKPGKEGQRLFKFNKVFSPVSTQADVFSDIQPLIRSVLDGYNVCIFAYGQTGSGKTYTMTGPNAATEDNWGVNYRALNDLFRISQSRRNTIMYEIGVQMVEIYNEQVRDLLANGGLPKKLGIMTHSQPNGLAVPDAAMHPVNSTADVMDLMDVGLNNRSVGATAMNERSSRSHSCVTIHVRGVDSKTSSTSHGNLHLVDLAGSERVDRSEVTGDRLKEAQHINKSLSALGDVIFALSQKSSHVPYRNSKLTQVLQSSLGGQAKTLMFVQLNPDSDSYSESLSTLKFAERVSGVELGAAKSNKEGRDVKELVEQVAFLKNTIAKKDEELQLLKELKLGSSSPLRRVSPSSRKESMTATPRKSPKLSNSNRPAITEKPSSDHEEVDRNDNGRKKSYDERHDPEMLSVGDDAGCEERSCDISDSDNSVGTELTDGTVENAVFTEEQTNSSNPRLDKLSRVSHTSRKTVQTMSLTPKSKGSSKVLSGIKKISSASSISPKTPSTRKWQ